MATTNRKTQCVTCNKERIAYKCEGCSQYLCVIHLADHHHQLSKQLDGIEDNYNLFRNILDEHTRSLHKCSLIEQINKWENDSIVKIQQTAGESRQLLMKYTNEYLNDVEVKVLKLTKKLKDVRIENDFNEIDLNEFKQKLEELKEQLKKSSNMSIQEDSSSFINRILISNTTSQFCSITSSDSHDDDVIFIGEIKPSTEQIDRARRLQLPSTFYLYESKDLCRGCQGCQEDRLPTVSNEKEQSKIEYRQTNIDCNQ